MMWMTEYVRKIKQGFRDRYGYEPVEQRGDDLRFAEGQIPDGEYPMEIDGKVDKVKMIDGKINCCNFD